MLLKLLGCEVWVSEEEGEDREKKRGGEKEGAKMMGQVWNLHTPRVARAGGTLASAR